MEQLSNRGLELARHIGLVLHDEDMPILSHPIVQHFLQLLHVSSPKDESEVLVFETETEGTNC